MGNPVETQAKELIIRRESTLKIGRIVSNNSAQEIVERTVEMVMAGECSRAIILFDNKDGEFCIGAEYDHEDHLEPPLIRRPVREGPARIFFRGL